MDTGLKLNSILVGILVLGLLVLGLLGVQFYLNRTESTTSETTSISNDQNTPQTAPNSEPTPAPFEQAIDNTALKNLSMIKKGILQSSILTNSYYGEIEKISTTGGFLPSANNFKFKIMIVIKSPQGDRNSFYYNDREAAILTGDVNSLKPGDKIAITETINLQEPQTKNIVSLSIEK